MNISLDSTIQIILAVLLLHYLRLLPVERMAWDDIVRQSDSERGSEYLHFRGYLIQLILNVTHGLGRAGGSQLVFIAFHLFLCTLNFFLEARDVPGRNLETLDFFYLPLDGREFLVSLCVHQ